MATKIANKSAHQIEWQDFVDNFNTHYSNSWTRVIVKDVYPCTTIGLVLTYKGNHDASSQLEQLSRILGNKGLAVASYRHKISCGDKYISHTGVMIVAKSAYYFNKLRNTEIEAPIVHAIVDSRGITEAKTYLAEVETDKLNKSSRTGVLTRMRDLSSQEEGMRWQGEFVRAMHAHARRGCLLWVYGEDTEIGRTFMATNLAERNRSLCWIMLPGAYPRTVENKLDAGEWNGEGIIFDVNEPDAKTLEFIRFLLDGILMGKNDFRFLDEAPKVVVLSKTKCAQYPKKRTHIAHIEKGGDNLVTEHTYVQPGQDQWSSVGDGY